MFSSFFDASKLTEKELYDKIDEVSTRLSAAMNLNMNQAVQESMHQVINSCVSELTNRQALKDLADLSKDPCVFDSDSYLSTNSDEKKKEDAKIKDTYIEKIYEILKNRRKRR